MVASKYTINENTEASVFISNEIGSELSVKKTKYVVMSQDQHALQNHNIYRVSQEECARLREGIPYVKVY